MKITELKPELKEATIVPSLKVMVKVYAKEYPPKYDKAGRWCNYFREIPLADMQIQTMDFPVGLQFLVDVVGDYAVYIPHSLQVLSLNHIYVRKP